MRSKLGSPSWSFLSFSLRRALWHRSWPFQSVGGQAMSCLLGRGGSSRYSVFEKTARLFHTSVGEEWQRVLEKTVAQKCWKKCAVQW